jgi:hypothetical protein
MRAQLFVIDRDDAQKVGRFTSAKTLLKILHKFNKMLMIKIATFLTVCGMALPQDFIREILFT